MKKYGFTSFTIDEFEAWIAARTIARTVTFMQIHHTWRPNYAAFNGTNHFEMQLAMKEYHVSTNGWADIGQNLTIFPEGTVMTGRSIQKTPACIFNRNAGAVCIENVGDFDTGKDTMRPAHADAIIRTTAALCKRLNLKPANDRNIVYHHWFDLGTGARTDGAGTTKSCPGTAFFGGNSVAAFKANFLPRVRSAMQGGVAGPAPVAVEKFVSVKVANLNVRSGPGTNFGTVSGIGSLQIATVLRVYEEREGWFKISNSKEHWVRANRTYGVRRATVKAAETMARAGAGDTFEIVRSHMAGEVVFVHEVSGTWSRVSAEPSWIRSNALK